MKKRYRVVPQSRQCHFKRRSKASKGCCGRGRGTLIHIPGGSMLLAEAVASAKVLKLK